MAEPSGIDPADPKGAEPGGAPSAEQKAKRLEQEVADLKKQLEEAKGQVTTLTENLGKALTEDDVKTAVEAAKQEAEKAQLAKDCGHLFQQPNTGTVSSAGTPGGNGKKMTRDEIMSIKDSKERRAAILANQDQFE